MYCSHAIVSPGKGQIRRSSTESALTLPTVNWLGITSNILNVRNCGCGLPHHLLLPKGTEEGKAHDVFVMATSAEDDFVKDEAEEMLECQNPPIWCPNYKRKYPDAKPMGYPFDRLPSESTEKAFTYLDEYTHRISNVKTVQVSQTAANSTKITFQRN